MDRGIDEALEGGEAVNIEGFGRFTTRHRAASRARNPRTRGAVPARTVAIFKPGKVLRDRLNGSHGDRRSLAAASPGFVRSVCAYPLDQCAPMHGSGFAFRPSPGLMRQEDPRGGSTDSESPNFLSVTGHRALPSPACARSQRSGQGQSLADGAGGYRCRADLRLDHRILSRLSHAGSPDPAVRGLLGLMRQAPLRYEG